MAPHEFKISAPGGQPTFHFRADDEFHAAEWCKALYDAIQVSSGCIQPAEAVVPNGQKASGRTRQLANLVTSSAYSQLGSLHTLAIFGAAVSPSTYGPCISRGKFDIDGEVDGVGDMQYAVVEESVSGDHGAYNDRTKQCTSGMPQAIRWTCNARLVDCFDVVWRRVSARTSVNHANRLSVEVHRERVGVSCPPSQSRDLHVCFLRTLLGTYGRFVWRTGVAHAAKTGIVRISSSQPSLCATNHHRGRTKTTVYLW